jgi:predicted acyltransferase
MTNSTATAAPPPPQPETPTRRLLSLDALRGFDMFWIVGGEDVIHGLYKACPWALFGLFDQQMNHQDWAGVHFYDLIFPLFVFIVGVSLVFSLTKTLEKAGRAAALKRILVRSLFIYLFGLMVYGGISKGLDHVRWLGVLQRIALCYFFTSLLFCFLRPRALLGVCVGLLAGYWALATFIPIRDFNLEKEHLRAKGLDPDGAETRAAFLATTNYVTGRFDDGLCLPQQIDFLYLPGHRWDGAYDPEGLLSTLPAIATCLLGVFTGLWLRNNPAPDQKKVLGLLGAGVAAVLLGFLWGLQFPVIKKIWDSSYVLVAAGYSCIFLGVMYQVVEIWGCRTWAMPFVWIGMNPITIYLIFHLLKPEDLAKLLVGGPIHAGLGDFGDLLLALIVVAMMFALVRFLYQRKIFLRL